MNKILQWAEAIKEFEGWHPGSRSWRNHNPGNLRAGSSMRPPEQDKKGYEIFANNEDGMDALLALLTRAAAGLSTQYHSAMSLVDFFKIFAPAADSKDPNGYALFVAARLQISPQAPIRSLLQETSAA